MKKLSIKKPQTSKKPLKSVANVAKRQILSFKQSVILVIILSLALYATSGYYWYQIVFTDPGRIMSDVLDKSLQTTAVSRTVSQKNGDNAINEATYVSFSPKLVSKTVSNLEEVGQDNSKTKVTTETVGVKDADYVRYTSINVEGGPKRDFGNVLNTWGARKANPETGASSSFLSDALFVAIPFGNLTKDQRIQLKDEISSVDLYAASETKKEFKNGRPVMAYTVQLDPQKLVKVLAQYVKITGAGNPATLDPDQYEGAAKIPIKIQIDILSRHVKTIEFASGRIETYRGYNATNNVTIPTQTVDVDELQARLQKVGSQQ